MIRREKDAQEEIDKDNLKKKAAQVISYLAVVSPPVLRIRIRIHRIHVFLGLLDPDPDPLVTGSDPDPALDPDPDPALDPDPDPSIIMQK